MKIEIDQSGKVEFTSHDTYLADSLGHVICLKAYNKRLLQEYFSQKRKPHMFVYDVFSSLLSILIKISYTKSNTYIIDVEYWADQVRLNRLQLNILQKWALNIVLSSLDL